MKILTNSDFMQGDTVYVTAPGPNKTKIKNDHERLTIAVLSWGEGDLVNEIL